MRIECERFSLEIRRHAFEERETITRIYKAEQEAQLLFYQSTKAYMEIRSAMKAAAESEGTILRKVYYHSHIRGVLVIIVCHSRTSINLHLFPCLAIYDVQA